MPEAIHGAYEGRRVLLSESTGPLSLGVQRLLADVECEILRVHDPLVDPPTLEGRAQVTDLPSSSQARQLWEKVLPETDVVFQLTGLARSYPSQLDPFPHLSETVHPVLVLLETVREFDHDAQLALATRTNGLAPSGAVSDETESRPFPKAIEAIHRSTVERYLLEYTDRGWMDGFVLRLPWIYGPAVHDPGEDPSVVNRILREALEGDRTQFRVEENALGAYLFSDIAARGLVEACASLDSLSGEIVRAGPDAAPRIEELTGPIQEAVKRASGDVIEIDLPGEPKLSREVGLEPTTSDATEVQDVFDWWPGLSLEETLSRTARSYQESQSPGDPSPNPPDRVHPRDGDGPDSDSRLEM